MIDLKSKGIETLIQTPRCVRDKDKDPTDFKELTDKYSGDERINCKLWKNVQFKHSNKEQQVMISEVRTDLFKRGVGFDTGTGYGSIDWEIDWSFSYKKGTLDFDKIEAANFVDEMADELLNKYEDE